MKTKLLLPLLLLSLSGFGQFDSTSIKKKNSITLELAGSAPLFSVNYERILYQKNKFKIAASAGFDPVASYLLLMWSWLGEDGIRIIFPLEIHFLIGKKNSFLELGVSHAVIINNIQPEQFYLDYDSAGADGIHYATKPAEVSNYVPRIFNLRIGYRYYSKSGGLFWRASWNPVWVYNARYKMEPFDKTMSIRKIYFNDYWRDAKHKQEYAKDYTIATSYNTICYGRCTGPEVNYKSILYIVNFGLSIGFTF